jgi:serine protease
VSACLLAAAAAGHASAAVPADEPEPFVPGQVVAGLAPGVSPSDIGVAGASLIRSTPDHLTLAVPPGYERQYIQTLLGEPGVRYAELNYLAQPQVIPNDEKYPLQWDMPMIQAPEAWNDTLGAGVTIAVLDTGVAFENYANFARDPELSQTTFVDPYDATKDDLHPNDDNGHGTHVTGTLAQDWNDGAGVAGLAPAAAIMPVKVCALSGCSGDAIAQGVRWAVDHGANVINLSLGGPSLPNVEREALQYAEQSGVVVVAAAGNGNAFVGDATLDYPARVDSVIAVGAVDLAGELTHYSNYGKHEHGGGLYIVAPGGDNHADLNNDGNPDGILQNTYATTCDGGTPNYTVFKDCFLQGTSMATPHVTGVVALLLSKYPGLTPEQVRTVLACSARDAGPPGPDDLYGAGIVQAAAAIRDVDYDNIPDCLEARPQLQLTAGSGPVEPGGAITIPVQAMIVGGAIGSYDVQFTIDSPVAQAVGCTAQPGSTCSISDTGSIVRITSGAAITGLTGAFNLAEITLRAGAATGSADLVLAASAGAVDDFSRPPEVSVSDGLVVVKYVPQTISGDVNCDGKVTPSDVIQALGYSLGVSAAFCWRYGDINCNGAIEAGDALAMLDFLSGIAAALPSGCPGTG